MREILFRGKRIDNGEWVEGSYWLNRTATRERPHIVENSGNLHLVIPETVGQYTDLTDKNGKKIFEGDILEFDDCGETGYEYKEGFDYTNRAVVVFNDGRFELDKFTCTNSGVIDEMHRCHDDFILSFKYGNIIGIIHDNPELLKEEQLCNS